MSYSDILATVALVISVLTSVWAGWRTWHWDRPVVELRGEQWIGGMSTDPERLHTVFSTEVINTGNQATQVLEAYWEIDRGNGLVIRFSAGPGGSGVQSLFEKPGDVKVPELPFTLERYGRERWEFTVRPEGILEPGKIRRVRPVVQFTSRKAIESVYGAWQQSQIFRLEALLTAAKDS